MLKLLFSVGFLFISYSGYTQDLDQLLAVDRIHFYLTDLGGKIGPKGHQELAEKLKSITPEEVWNYLTKKGMTKSVLELKDYDSLLQDMIRAKYPEVTKTEAANIKSNHQFFKNKLNEKFGKRAITFAPTNLPGLGPLPVQNYEIPKLDKTALTLDADQYIANRQTRAIFWDAIVNGTDVEFYMGKHEEFVNSLLAKEGQIMGEITTISSNYNKNYLIYYPATNKYAYAITEISGKDRLYHLVKQMSKISWQGQTAAVAHKGVVKVFADPKMMEKHTKELSEMMEVLPKADHVIVGQKGAVERKLKALRDANKLLDVDPTAELTKKEANLLSEYKTSRKLSLIVENTSDFEKIAEKLLPDAGKDILYTTVETQSFDLTDLTFKDAQGNSKRLRLISNVWGDEMAPIIESLINTGHHDITYIGTAGSLHSDLKVGDLVRPTHVEFMGQNLALGTPKNLPEMKLTQVKSLLDESHTWFENKKANGYKLVEMEVGYLAKSKQAHPHLRLNVYLMISDAVGAEGETLEGANSNARKDALATALNETFEYNKIKDVELSQNKYIDKVHELIETKKPKLHPLAKLRLYNEINEAGVLEKLDDAKLLKKANSMIEDFKGFTGDAMNKFLGEKQTALENLHADLKKSKKAFKLEFGDNVLTGNLHPKNSKPDLIISYSPANQNSISSITANYADDFNVILVQGQMELDKQSVSLVEEYRKALGKQFGILTSVSKSGNITYKNLSEFRICNKNF